MRVERVEEVKGEGGKAYPNLLEKAEATALRVRVPGVGREALDAPDGASIRSTCGAAANLAWCSPTPREISIGAMWSRDGRMCGFPPRTVNRKRRGPCFRPCCLG